jgi:hypothetical protein
MVDSISTGSDTAIPLQTVSDDKNKEDKYEQGTGDAAMSPRPGSTHALPQLENGRSEPESELDKKVERKWMAAIYGLMFLAGELSTPSFFFPSQPIYGGRRMIRIKVITLMLTRFETDPTRPQFRSRVCDDHN